MAETKRKSRGEGKRGKLNKKTQKQKHARIIGGNNESSNEKMKKRSGPRLPNLLRKDLDQIHPSSLSYSDEEIDSDEGEIFSKDVYEYEESVPEEESKKNRRFDPVENFEYELPERFEDENVFSDDDDENDNKGDDGGIMTGDANDDEIEVEDNERHGRMLEGITGMPSEAFEGKKRNNVVITEAYPESEYNPTRDVLDGNGRISIQDLLDPLHGKSGYSKLRKKINQIEKKSTPIHAPLSKAEQKTVERTVAYEKSKKEISRWEPIVKRNREAPTVYFGEDADLGFSTVGAIASEFEPRTEIEKKIALLVYDDRIMEAHKKDGSRLLEMNKISFEDEKDRQNRIAKMRSLLFRHEMKAKHIKKIKSKAFRHREKKNAAKDASAPIQLGPDAAKELAMKQEFKRAEERMTLKHKNSSKWAKRIIKRGLSIQDDDTRVAIIEQLKQHSILTRKMNSMRDSSSGSSSSDESSDEDDVDEHSAGSDQRALKLLEKAKEKTLKVLDDDEDEIPDSGILSLPFMIRGMKKRKEAVTEEAKLALQDLDSLSRQLEGSTGTENPNAGSTSGRRIFGATKKQAPESRSRTMSDNYYGDSDSENDSEANRSIEVRDDKNEGLQKDAKVDSIILHENSRIHQDSVFKSFDETIREPGPKTTYEVSILTSDTWKRVKNGKEVDTAAKHSSAVTKVLHDKNLKETEEMREDSDSDHEVMVDGTLSLGLEQPYKLPSQEELIRQAFAGDDVEEEFERDKEEILNEENPEPEKPVLLPGWGQWTHIQQKKGLPSWMLQEHENAKKKQQEALKERKDAHLKHVIISERLDKKAEKLHTKTLPYPFTSKEVYEQSIRMPIGPEFNPATAIGALNRPEVVKKSGVIIKPIEFEEVNPHEKFEENTSNGRKQKRKGRNDGKSAKKTKRK